MITLTEIEQHTPGPWVAREQMSKDHRSLGWIVEFGEGYRIGWASYADKTNWNNRTADAANARVMAAAPDLLAACKAALGAFENNNAIDWGDLERAIAKAEIPVGE